LGLVALLVLGVSSVMAADPPPEYANLVPPDGAANVPVDTTIEVDVVDLDVGVDPSSVVLQVNGELVSPELTAIESGYHLAFVPPDPFAYGDRVQVAVGACDLDASCSDLAWEFTTATGEDVDPPVFAGFVPEPGAVGVPWDTVIAVDVYDGGVGVDPASLVMEVNGGAVTPEITAIESGFHLEFRPPSPLPPLTEFVVSVAGCDLAGNCARESWSFVTADGEDIYPPEFTGFVPEPGAEGVPWDTVIAVDVIDLFSGVDEHTLEMVVNGTVVTPQVSAIEGGYHLEFAPAEPLPPGMEFVVQVAACDLAGNCGAFDWWFVTATGEDVDPPEFLEPVPAPGATGVPLDTLISVAIVDAGVGVDPATMRLAVDGVEVTAEAEAIPGGYRLVFDPPGQLPPGTEFSVAASACDLAGNCDTFEWSFVTIDGEDVYPPEFLDPEPLPGAVDVPRDTPIGVDVIDLGSGVDPASVVLAVEGEPLTAELTAIPGGFRVVYVPDAPLPAGRTLTASVAACDLAGNCSTFEWSFTTEMPPDEEPPVFLDEQPPAGATGVPADTAIEIDILDELSGVDAATVTLAVNGETVSPLTVAIPNGVHVYYLPERPFPPGSEVAVAVSACDAAGNCGGFEWSFTTELPDADPPYVLNRQPPDGAGDVPPDAEVSAEVLDDGSGVDPDSLALSIEGQPVEFALEPIEGGYRIVALREEPFAHGQTVLVELAACDLAGNCIRDSWSFQVVGDPWPPEFTELYPPPGAVDVPVDTEISLVILDEGSGVDPSSVVMLVNDQPVSPTLNPVPGGYEALYMPPSDLPYGAVITVAAGACDLFGNCADTSWRFTTVLPPDEEPPVFLDPRPPDGARDVPVDATIEILVADEGVGVDSGSLALFVNGVAVAPLLILPVPEGYLLAYTPTSPWPYGSELVVTAEGCDLLGNCGGFEWAFQTEEQPDQDPPEIHRPRPEPGATDVPASAPVSALVIDELSGVDPDSIAMEIDGEPVRLEIEAVAHGYRVRYANEAGFEPGAEVSVLLFAADLAGNSVEFPWQFTVADESSEAPELVYPQDGAWLNYYLEDGMIRFSWRTDDPGRSFRLRIQVDGLDPITIDLGPDDYSWIFDVATVAYPLSEESWDVFARLGPVRWTVAGISESGGEPTTPFADPFTFFPSPTNSVLLRTPEDFAEIPESEPPTFSWDPYPNAASYVIGLARIGDDGRLIDDIFFQFLPGYVTEIPVSPGSWAMVPDGHWLWTVIAFDDEGDTSNFMIFHFTKTSHSADVASPADLLRPAPEPEAGAAFADRIRRLLEQSAEQRD
jgi:hypothetical protein